LQLPLLASSGSSAITMSAGFALYPWEASDGEHLLWLADQRALRAKLDGKDTIVFGSPPSSDGGANGAPPKDSH
jgi:GGDEF domain-containing protein